MSVLDRIIGIFAPHRCSGCGADGHVLCGRCALSLPAVPERCYRCYKLSPLGGTCRSCRKVVQLNCVRPAAQYDGIARDVVRRLKYDGARAAASDIATLMVPYLLQLAAPLPERPVLVPAPTTAGRRRERGYDQAELLARELSRRTGLPCSRLLRRHGNAHQVGATRAVRLKQLNGAFRLNAGADCKGRYVILIDDVMTTGGTLEAAAKTLRAGSAAGVDAVVFAVA